MTRSQKIELAWMIVAAAALVVLWVRNGPVWAMLCWAFVLGMHSERL